MAGHNCLQDQIWEVPYFLVSSGRGPAIYDGKSKLSFSPAGKEPFNSGYDLVLANDGTLSSSESAAHPDNNDQVNLPTQYRYSDWRPESGVLLPHTIEKYTNGSLVLCYQVQSVSVQ